MTTKAIPLFDRKYRIVIDTIEIKGPGLDCTFSVKKDLKPQPNTANLQIWNLNPTHRKAIEVMKDVPVLIEAGYAGGTSIIFLGDLRFAASTSDDAGNIVTELTSGDGEKKTQKARINKTVPKKTPTTQVIKMIAEALGVGAGNVDQAAATIQAAGFGTLFEKGTLLHGSAVREMTAICRACGLTWSVQNGKLQILPLATALAGEAILISRKTGMIGVPTVDNKKVLKTRILMAPEVYPGRKVVMAGETLKGQYRIETTEHTGDTFADDWYIDIEGKRY